MARSFNGTSSYLGGTTAPVTAYPFTMACWFNINNVTTDGTMMAMADTAGTANSWTLLVAGTAAGDPLRFTSRAGGTNAPVSTSTAVTASTWHHACGIATSATSRAVLLNGGGAGTTSTSSSPAGVDNETIGALKSSAAATQFFDGLIADAAIWNTNLTTAEVQALAAGASPLLIRPQNLIRYRPLIEPSDNCWVCGLGMTAISSPGWSAHPAQATPSWVFVTQPGFAVAGGATYSESATDGWVTGETVAEMLRAQATASDGLLGGEARAGESRMFPSAVDGAVWGEFVTGLLQAALGATDGVKLGEILTGALRMAPGATDGFLLGEIAGRLLRHTRTALDGWKGGETASGLLQMEPASSEGLRLGEAILAVARLLAATSDGAAWGEQIAGTVRGSLSATDGALFGELASGDYGIALSPTVTDGLRFGEAVLATAHFGSIALDGWRFGDSASIPTEFAALLGVVGILTSLMARACGAAPVLTARPGLPGSLDAAGDLEAATLGQVNVVPTN